MNSANHISRAVLAFVIYIAAMVSVHVIRASIYSVARLKRKLKKKASLICYREGDENKTFKKISNRQTGCMRTKTEEPIATTWVEDQLYVTEALLLYLLVTNQEITPNRIFVEYHKIVEFCSEVKSYENVFSLHPKSLSAVTKKIREIKGKIKVENLYY